MPDNKLPPVPSGMIPVDPPDDTGALPPPPEGLTAVEPPDTYERAPKPYQPSGDQGIVGAFTGGVQQTGRALGAFADVLQGDEEEILEDAKLPSQKTGAQMRFMEAIERNKDNYGDEGVWQAIKNVAGAAYDEPMGALHEMAAQLPNSGAVLASAGAGAAAGSAVPGVGTGIGAIVGGALGYLFGNTAIETGFIAQEMGQEKDVDTGKALKQGAIKGGVITGVDLATMGFNRFLAGAPGKAASEAVKKVFSSAGVDAADAVAMRAAIQANPALIMRAKEAAIGASVAAMPKGMRKAALATTGVALESVSEGAGEYFGSKAAGLDASYTEAVMESLLSLPQSGIETGIAQTFGKPETPEAAAAGTMGALDAVDFVGPRNPLDAGPQDIGLFGPGETPPDAPALGGISVEEVPETVLQTPPEPIPTTAEGIEVGLEITPIQDMASKFRDRLRGEGQEEAPRTNLDDIEEITATGIEGATEPSVAALTDRIWKETAFDKAEIERKKKKEAEEADIAAIGAKAIKERKPEEIEAETTGLREDIDRRREETWAAFTAETPEGMTRDEQVEAYLAANEQLDKEEKALNEIVKQRQKAKKEQEKAKKEAKPAPVGEKSISAVAPVAAPAEEEPLPLPEVKELDPGVLDEKRPASGKPYPTRAAAENIRKIAKKYADYEVVEKDGGFVLQDFGKTPEPPTTEGIEVEELKKIPGPKPKVQPKTGTTGNQLGDALRDAGLQDSLDKYIAEQFPYYRRQAGDVITEEELRKLMPSDEEFIQDILDGKIPKALQRQAGDTDETAAREPEPFVGPPREVAGFLERDPDDLMPGKNGPEFEPTPAQAEIERRKNRTRVNKQLTDEGLEPGSPEARARAKEIRALEGLDDDYNPIQGPPAGGVTGPPDGGAMGPPAGGAMGPPAPTGEGPTAEFTPTYELPDGTKVAPVEGEENTYVDANGDEYIEPNATPITEEAAAVTFKPYKIKSHQEVFGMSDEDLASVPISQEAEDGRTVYPAASVLLNMSETRISILNQLGTCLS